MTGPHSHEPSLATSWFEKSAPASEPVPSSVPLPPPDEADPKLALVFGALSGGAGGAAMIFVADALARRQGVGIDIVRTVGRAARFGSDPYVVGIGVAVAIGVVVGLAFGALLRHARRFIARALAGVLFAAILWTLVHAFVLKSFAPTTLGALPVLPMVVGASLLGLAVALLRPPRRLLLDTEAE